MALKNHLMKMMMKICEMNTLEEIAEKGLGKCRKGLPKKTPIGASMSGLLGK